MPALQTFARLFDWNAPSVENRNTEIAIDPTQSRTGPGRAPAWVGAYYSKAQANPVSKRCIELIASSLAGLPKYVVQGVPPVRVENDRVNELLADPHPRSGTPYGFWEDLFTRMVIEGNAFAAILRRPIRIPEAIELIPAECEDIVYGANGRLYYKLIVYDRRVRSKMSARIFARDIVGTSNTRFTNLNVRRFGGVGYSVVLPEEDVLHLKFSGSGYLDIPVAPSPVLTAQAIFESWIAASDFRLKLKRGKNPTGFLSFPQASKMSQIIEPYGQWKDHREKNPSGISVLPLKSEFVPTGFSNADMQLLDDMKFEVVNLSRVFGVPLYLLNHFERNMGRNDSVLEGQWTNFNRISLIRHIHAIQSELNKKLGLIGTGRSTHFDTDKLTQGSDRENAIISGELVQKGVMVANEVRMKFWDMGPAEGGDKLAIPAGASEAEPNGGNDEGGSSDDS